MKETDIRMMGRASLVDVKDIVIKDELTREERIIDYIEQIKNPYCYLDHGVAVKLSFSGTKKLEDCLTSCIEREN